MLMVMVSVGCSQNNAENEPEKVMPAGTGKAINPNGKPQTADEQKIADERMQGGQAAGRAMAQAAQQMKEAQQRSGGK